MTDLEYRRSLKKLFWLNDEGNIIELDAAHFVVYVSYADHTPIVTPNKELAEQIESALEEAFNEGVGSGQCD